jgi:hypothetical protein
MDSHAVVEGIRWGRGQKVRIEGGEKDVSILCSSSDKNKQTV